MIDKTFANSSATIPAAIAALALWLLSAPVLGLPDNASARFALTAKGLDIAQVEWTFESTPNKQIVYRSESRTIGVAKLLRDESVVEFTRIRLHEQRVIPLEYGYERRGKRERQAQVKFDWPKATAVNTLNGQQWTLALTAGVQDKLSYLLALMQALKNGQRPERIVVTDGGKAKTYAFEYLGNETLTSALGTTDTLIVKRREEGDPRETKVWLAPAFDYFPIRLEHSESGETTTLKLLEAHGLKAQ